MTYTSTVSDVVVVAGATWCRTIVGRTKQDSGIFRIGTICCAHNAAALLARILRVAVVVEYSRVTELLSVDTALIRRGCGILLGRSATFDKRPWPGVLTSYVKSEVVPGKPPLGGCAVFSPAAAPAPVPDVSASMKTFSLEITAPEYK